MFESLDARGRCGMGTAASVVVAIVLASGPASGADQEWPASEVAEHAGQMLAERMKAIDFGGAMPEQHLRDLSRQSMDALVARLDSWGEKTVLQHAPALQPLAVPRAKQPQLDAMARYFTCASVYEVLHLRGGFKNLDREGQVKAAMASPSLTVVSLYLRHQYLKGGGTDAKMEAFLTGPQMEPVIAKIQDDPKLLEAAHAECRALVNWLVHE